MNLLICVIGVNLGLFGHYLREVTKDNVSGSFWTYLKTFPWASVTTISAAAGVVVTLWSTGIIDDHTGRLTVFMAGACAGYMADSLLNKGPTKS